MGLSAFFAADCGHGVFLSFFVSADFLGFCEHQWCCCHQGPPESCVVLYQSFWFWIIFLSTRLYSLRSCSARFWVFASAYSLKMGSVPLGLMRILLLSLNHILMPSRVLVLKPLVCSTSFFRVFSLSSSLHSSFPFWMKYSGSSARSSESFSPVLAIMSSIRAADIAPSLTG